MTAKQDENKMVLSVKAREETCKAHSAAVEKFMEKPAANVVGLAEGIKWKNHKPTGESALIVLDTHKVEKGQLSTKDLGAAEVGYMQTDVLDVGFPFAGGEAESSGAGIQTLGNASGQRKAAKRGDKSITAALSQLASITSVARCQSARAWRGDSYQMMS